jgi:peptidoglycan hydrolase CwlO-like protein
MASVEETTRVYQEAETALQNLNAQIAENEAKAAEIQTRLPEQRARAAASIRTLYKFQQNTPGLLDLICSAEDFNDFVSTLHYIDSITERNTAEIRALSDLQDEEKVLMAQYELAFDLAAIEKQLTADGTMVRAGSGQTVYLDLSEGDNVVYYEAAKQGLSGFVRQVEQFLADLLS